MKKIIKTKLAEFGDSVFVDDRIRRLSEKVLEIRKSKDPVWGE